MGSIYNSSYCHHQIESINPSQYCHISVVVYLRRLCQHMLSVSYIYIMYIYIYIPGKLGFASLKLLCILMMSPNNRVHYDPMVVYFYLHMTLPHYHYADLFEGIQLLQTCLSDIFCLECVSIIRSVLSFIFHAINGSTCIQLTHLSYDDCEKTCIWSYYHHQIESMTHLPLFRLSSWNNGMHCMSFYILKYTYMKSDVPVLSKNILTTRKW